MVSVSASASANIFASRRVRRACAASRTEAMRPASASADGCCRAGLSPMRRQIRSNHAPSRAHRRSRLRYAQRALPPFSPAPAHHFDCGAVRLEVIVDHPRPPASADDARRSDRNSVLRNSLTAICRVRDTSLSGSARARRGRMRSAPKESIRIASPKVGCRVATTRGQNSMAKKIR